MIAACVELPTQAKRRPNLVLAYGEVTGHSHRIKEQDAAELWEANGTLFLKVVADRATVIHEEHAPVTLPRGLYRVWRQREYTPQAIRVVRD